MKTARKIGSENLTKPDIEAHIQKRLAEMKMSADEVLLLLSDHAHANINHFTKVTEEGFVYFDFSQPGALEHMHLIKKIKSKRSRRIEGRGDSAETWEDETAEVELHDAQTALDKLGRHHRLFDDKPALSLSVNFEGFGKLLDKVYGSKPDNG